MLLSMLKLRKIRDLRLAGTSPSRPDYVYSASGLVEAQHKYFIIADDELHLAIFPKNRVDAGRWLRLLPGELADDYKQRKKQKPDLEAITVLSPNRFAPGGALLVVPSLSRSNRIRGALVLLNEDHVAEPIPIDFCNIHKELSTRIKQLNIEGLVVTKQTVRLFHRGSHENSKSAVIDIDTSQFIRDLHDTHSPTANAILNIRQYDLGKLNGLDLAFTDASMLPDGRILFLAAAENSRNAYDDGSTAGSAVGLLNKEAEVVQMEHFEGLLKLEGISATKTGEQLNLSLVADSDDEHVPAALFAATWIAGK
jgi:hypothetical protein